MKRDIPLHAVLSAYVEKGSVDNKALFEQLSLDLSMPAETLLKKAPVGRSGEKHNLFARSVRWHQQTLKRLGVIERMDRGVWRLTDKAKAELTQQKPQTVMLAFSTELGCALWGNAQDVFANLQEEITLAFTSPPYPLAVERQYGNVEQGKYVDWLVQMLEPIVKNLRAGGSLVLNLSNDIFVPGMPSRSLYLERVTLALHDRLGLHLMDRFVWHNPSKPPGPIQWASLRRMQLNVAYEPVLYFTNDPMKALGDNRRCLIEHTDKQKKLIEQGGEQRNASNSGGAYVIKQGSYSNETRGAIARNLQTIGHRDADQTPARKFCKEMGLPAHPAPMPTKLAEFFVEFLSNKDDLVVDPFGGWATTGKAAENKGRRWIVTERCKEYLLAASERFKKCEGFSYA